MYFEFGCNRRAVKLDRAFVNTQEIRDLLVELALDDQAQDFALARSEGAEASKEALFFRALQSLPGIALERPLYRG